MASDSAPTPAQQRRQKWGRNLTEALHRREWTAVHLRQALLQEKGVDVSLQAISLWLGGGTAPTPENQAAIAAVLDMPVGDLFAVEVAR